MIEKVDTCVTNVAQPVEAIAPALWWSALSVMLVGLVFPLFLVDLPPLCDYPAHLARALFLATGETDPVTSRMFAPRWEIAPNLALDLILPPLIRLMPTLMAGKILIGLAALLPATGSIAINRALFGRRSLWSLAVGLVVYNVPFLLGFINFQIGIGVALWGAAAWIWLAPRRPFLNVAVGILFGLAAFFSHLFAFAFFAVLIGCVELAALRQSGYSTPADRRVTIFRMCALAAALLPPALLYLVSPLASTGGPVIRHDGITKLKTLAGPVVGYSPALTYLILAALIVIFGSLIATRRLRVAPLMYVALPLLLIVFFALPTGAKGVFYIDTRIPVMIGFMLFAATLPQVTRNTATGILVVLAALFVGRIALITHVWGTAQHDIVAVRSVLSTVTPGSRVLPVEVSAADPQKALPPARAISNGYPANYTHYGSLAYIDRHAFWSDAFTIRGQQPVTVLPAYERSRSSMTYKMQDYRSLIPAVASRAPHPSYLDDWTSKFDYVLVLNVGDPSPINRFLPDKLTLVSRRGFAMLFKVRRTA